MIKNIENLYKAEKKIGKNKANKCKKKGLRMRRRGKKHVKKKKNRKRNEKNYWYLNEGNKNESKRRIEKKMIESLYERGEK